MRTLMLSNKKTNTLIVVWMICIQPGTLFTQTTSKKPKFQGTSYWSKILDEDTKKYAWATYQQFFQKKIRYPIDHTIYLKRLHTAPIQFLSTTDLILQDIGNQRLERYWTAKTPQEIYPEGDRPRGNIDIMVFEALLTTDKKVSPIALGIIPAHNGDKIIVLDGMHRIMAAHLLKYPVACLIVDLR